MELTGSLFYFVNEEASLGVGPLDRRHFSHGGRLGEGLVCGKKSSDALEMKN